MEAGCADTDRMIDGRRICDELAKRPHPRLFATTAVLQQTRRDIDSDLDLLGRAWEQGLVARAKAYLETPPVMSPNAPQPVTLDNQLDFSRNLLKHIQVLGIAHFLQPDERFAACAKAELLSACDLPHWNPEKFLAVAETAHAVAIGYDWLYDRLSPDERSRVRQVLIRNAFAPGLAEFERRTRACFGLRSRLANHSTSMAVPCALRRSIQSLTGC